jgi:hypothetical protein
MPEQAQHIISKLRRCSLWLEERCSIDVEPYRSDSSDRLRSFFNRNSEVCDQVVAEDEADFL